jgi:hypothetical protein
MCAYARCLPLPVPDAMRCMLYCNTGCQAQVECTPDPIPVPVQCRTRPGFATAQEVIVRDAAAFDAAMQGAQPLILVVAAPSLDLAEITFSPVANRCIQVGGLGRERGSLR